MGRFADTPDLATMVRPRLDAINSRLLRAVMRAWPALTEPAQGRHVAAASESFLARHGGPVAALAAHPCGT